VFIRYADPLGIESVSISRPVITGSFGGINQTKEEYRNRRGLRFLEAFAQDLRYAIRAFRKGPAFAGAAVATLGLAIGANTTIFSFADGLAFRPPAVQRPAELVRIFTSTKDSPFGRVAYPDYLDLKNRNTTLSGVVAYYETGLPVARSRDEAAQLVGALIVSGNYFSVLGAEPTAGRGFRDDDDRVPGAAAVVVISHNFWERSFHSDPAVLGGQIIVANRAFTIIGVAPVRFPSTDLFFHPDLYIPIAMINDVVSSFPANLRNDRSMGWLTVLGRLRRGVGAAAASAEMTALGRSLQQAYPETNRQRMALALPEVAARDKEQGNYQISALLIGIAGLVLVLACVNVANLMLSHAAGRSREIAVRLAIGASRGRLVRQLLTESLLLAIGGGVGGLALAYGGVRYLLSALGQMFAAASDLPFMVDFRIDERVLLFTLITTFATAVVFGLMPALQSTRVDLVSALKASSRAGTIRRRFLNTRSVLVASQVALSLATLALAGFSIQGFIVARRTDPGFRTDHVLLLSFDPSTVGYSQNQMTRFYDQIITRTKALSGVQAVGLAQSIPLVNGLGTTAVVVDGFEMLEGQEALSIRSSVVDPGYWSAMRTRIVQGRRFDERDTSMSPRVIVVNETMARRYWQGQDPVGKTVHFNNRAGVAAQVIGIAQDGKYNDIAEPLQPAFFMPFSQKNNPWMAATLIVRTTGGATNLATAIRAEVRALDVGMPVFNVRSFERAYEAAALSKWRLLPQIMISLGGLATMLATIGLYGVMAYLTAFRTREIGIRIALGADRARVLLMVLTQAVGMVAVGLVVGVSLVFALTPVFASAFEFVPRAPTVLAAVSLLLIAAACVASFIPARRAVMVNPTVALRDE